MGKEVNGFKIFGKKAWDLEFVSLERELPFRGQRTDAKVTGDKEYHRHHKRESARDKYIKEEVSLRVYHIPVLGIVVRVGVGGTKEDYQENDKGS